jgi:hypothetical protein
MNLLKLVEPLFAPLGLNPANLNHSLHSSKDSNGQSALNGRVLNVE